METVNKLDKVLEELAKHLFDIDSKIQDIDTRASLRMLIK